MPTLFQRGATWLGDRLKESVGRSVAIRRKGTIIGSGITGTVSKHEYTVFDEEGIATNVPMYDWLFTAADLGVVPRDGDRIAEILNGVESQYEVTPLADKGCVEPADTSGILLLVHSTKVV